MKRQASATSTQVQQDKKNLQTIERELKGIALSKPSPRLQNRTKEPPKDQKAKEVDICGISRATFHLNMKRKENTFFTTSLYEIDRELERRTELPSSPEDRQLYETESEWL